MCSALVVVTAGCFPDLVLSDLVDQAMLISDPAGPVAVEAMLERLGLADSLVAVALDVGDQGVNPLEDPAVLGLPPDLVRPGGFVPDELHSSRSRSTPPSCSRRSMEASSRRAFSGLRSR